MKLCLSREKLILRTAFITIACTGIVSALMITNRISSPDQEKNIAVVQRLSKLQTPNFTMSTDTTKNVMTTIENDRKKAKSEARTKSAAAAAKQAAVSSSAHSNPNALDVIVNKKHPLSPLSFTPIVQTISCAGSSSATLNVTAAKDFMQMCGAASSAGVPLAVSSSFRSYKSQVTTYNYWVSVNGQAGADRVSARPGYSEHQTGLAADFITPSGAGLSSFCGTAEQVWMSHNAYKFGWIQRYTTANRNSTGYDPECWHYRYIGRANAQHYANSGAISLETFWNVSGGLY